MPFVEPTDYWTTDSVFDTVVSATRQIPGNAMARSGGMDGRGESCMPLQFPFLKGVFALKTICLREERGNGGNLSLSCSVLWV